MGPCGHGRWRHGAMRLVQKCSKHRQTYLRMLRHVALLDLGTFVLGWTRGWSCTRLGLPQSPSPNPQSRTPILTPQSRSWFWVAVFCQLVVFCWASGYQRDWALGRWHWEKGIRDWDLGLGNGGGCSPSSAQFQLLATPSTGRP